MTVYAQMMGFPGGTSGKELACQYRRCETWVPSPGWEDPLEEEMATHSSILAWRIPWTEESGGLVHEVAKSQTRLKQLSACVCVCTRLRACAHTYTHTQISSLFTPLGKKITLCNLNVYNFYLSIILQ